MKNPNKNIEENTSKKLTDHVVNEVLPIPIGTDSDEVHSSDGYLSNYDSESEVEENNNNVNKGVRKAGYIWLYEVSFGTKEELDLFIETEYCWGLYQNVISKKNGKKTVYRCNRSKKREKQCEAQIYTIYDDGEYKLFRRNNAHTHQNEQENMKGVPQKVKNEIIRLVDQKHMPKTILFMLLQNPEMQPVPTKNQINYIARKHRETKFGNPSITLVELQDFLQKNSVIPSGEDEPFVLKYETSDIEDEEQDSHWFRFIVSTKRLLEMALKTNYFHVDGTYKLNYHGYPVLVIGTSDKKNQFHLIGKYK